MPILVMPIALCSLLFLFKIAWYERRFLEIFPLILFEVNSLFIWSCSAAFEIFILVNRHSPTWDYRYFLNDALLGNAITLAPLNIFLYSWRFLKSLERDLTRTQKSVCGKVSIAIGWTVSLVYYAVFIAFLMS